MPTVLWRFLSRSLYQFFVIFLFIFVCFYVSMYRRYGTYGTVGTIIRQGYKVPYIKSLLVLVYYCKSHSAALDRDERLGV